MAASLRFAQILEAQRVKANKPTCLCGWTCFRAWSLATAGQISFNHAFPDLIQPCIASLHIKRIPDPHRSPCHPLSSLIPHLLCFVVDHGFQGLGGGAEHSLLQSEKGKVHLYREYLSELIAAVDTESSGQWSGTVDTFGKFMPLSHYYVRSDLYPQPAEHSPQDMERLFLEDMVRACSELSTKARMDFGIVGQDLQVYKVILQSRCSLIRRHYRSSSTPERVSTSTIFHPRSLFSVAHSSDQCHQPLPRLMLRLRLERSQHPQASFPLRRFHFLPRAKSVFKK